MQKAVIFTKDNTSNNPGFPYPYFVDGFDYIPYVNSEEEQLKQKPTQVSQQLVTAQKVGIQHRKTFGYAGLQNSAG